MMSAKKGAFSISLHGEPQNIYNHLIFHLVFKRSDIAHTIGDDDAKVVD